MGIFANLSEWKKLLIVVLAVVVFIFLSSALGSLLLVFFGAETMLNAPQGVYTPESVVAMRWLQGIVSVGTFVLPPLLLALLFSHKPLRYIGLRRSSWCNIGLALAGIVVAIPGINLLSSLNDLVPLTQWMTDMENSAELLLNAFLADTSIKGVIGNILIISIIPAIGEEMLFRGLVQKHLSKIMRSATWGIIVTGLIFSLFHMQFKGFVPRFLLGVLLGYLYHRSGSLWVPIVAHLTNNLMSIVATMLMNNGLIGNQLEEIGTLQHLCAIGLASIAIVVMLVARIKVKERENDIEVID